MFSLWAISGPATLVWFGYGCYRTNVALMLVHCPRLTHLDRSKNNDEKLGFNVLDVVFLLFQSCFRDIGPDLGRAGLETATLLSTFELVCNANNL